jgi:hypothetical protein
MTEIWDNSLLKFYNLLYDNLELKKKLKDKSIIKSFIDIKANDRYRLLNDSSITSEKLPTDQLQTLLKTGMIRNTDEINKYIITAKGVWEIEKNNNIISELSLIEFIDNKFYNFFDSEIKLRDREKSIIFSMICARSFSLKSSVDLKKDDFALNSWKEIIEKCADKLISLNIINTKNKENLFGGKSTEHPVSNLIRHTDELPRKTKGLYKAAGKQQYFLDIFKDNVFNKEELSYLIWIVFSEQYDNIIIDDILKFCNNIAYNESVYVYDINTHIFSTPEYDDILRDAFRESIILKNKWELT